MFILRIALATFFFPRGTTMTFLIAGITAKLIFAGYVFLAAVGGLIECAHRGGC